jgi:amidophosphoribosyltransferase
MHGSHRLFMTDNEKHGIKHKVIGKLSLVPDPAIWKGAKVVLCDDSIVRGNVSAKITRACFYMGAKEVHWVVGYPPVMHRCHLGVSIRTKTELIASLKKGDPKRIAKEIGATSVTYISPTSFIRARLPDNEKIEKPANMQEIFLRNGGCGGCVTGLYPVGKDGKKANLAE